MQKDEKYESFNPRFKRGDKLRNRDGKEQPITVIAIVADQYKYWGEEEYPLYEFVDYIDANYDIVSDSLSALIN